MGEPRWLDEREAQVWKMYRDLRRDLQSAQDRQLLRDSGLSGADYALLVPLSEASDGLMRSRELGLEVGWERSRLSHQIIRMEKRGLVTREACADDARGAMVRLTASGRAAIEGAAPLHVETVRQFFFDPLTSHEVDTLGTLIGKMLDALNHEQG
ncbi:MULTISPECIES: MarR family winged helix-turn-helix transcriptional regulator [Streptomyces]|uniref:MarR family transcriptional regulator n=1 Tax=Streptomyces tsukubensis (strain DSM 42081 / NBRC 108919 / NRRL 18488 / 9993) TaxID=1114943 RepID=I2NAQ3_STRT9|nr:MULTISPECIES: MarR family transcriptional regulator [Streptomyces]AZK97876.1 MarR family transcriptional regulator [Streptomyces tsukubensis]EIF94100.1 MarR family transcriptional regulator [Streptomyces tsukubensis NRRL18488]MYS67254.1 MarR family transcriptional regulator [Streptomyces sp. SID5473]QKM66195.1 MarR family transcriptional regulator [Streptomyces tsukubensis NRRL18488]TAI45467.1 MarR family transcriptional regulator [Streptomyces tsukubensis]